MKEDGAIELSVTLELYKATYQRLNFQDDFLTKVNNAMLVIQTALVGAFYFLKPSSTPPPPPLSMAVCYLEGRPKSAAAAVFGPGVSANREL